MDKLERDDFVFALEQTMAFYNKELEPMHISFWVDACRDRPVEKLKLAFREHYKSSRFAPKPADILALVANMQEQKARNQLPPPPTTNCPPDIADAWLWFNRMLTAGTSMEGILGKAEEVEPELQEKYLHVVNHEAHKYDMPDAIPDEYKLREVWG